MDYDQCYYPLPSAPYYVPNTERAKDMREISSLLREISFQYLAESNLATAFEKLSLLTQMSRHLRQQPIMLDYLMSIGIEGFVLRFLSCVTMQRDITEEYLDMVVAISGRLDNDWDKVKELMLEVEQLHVEQQRKEFRRWQWHPGNWKYILMDPFSDYSETIMESANFRYLRLIADQRMLPILVELRRFCHEQGHWPESLDEIKSRVPESAWVDPYNEAPFVYRKDENGVRLYSKGPNGIDEDGSRAGPADDRMFWPPSGNFKEKLPMHKTLGIGDALQEN